MTHKRFDHPNETLTDKRGHSGTRLPNGVNTSDAAEELYSRLGERFPVKWQPWTTAEPVIDTDDLPANVSEADVENALSNMKAEGEL